MRVLYLILIVFFSFLFTFLFIEFNQRLGYMYNENQVCFSEEGIIYKEQSIAVFGGLAFFSAVVILLLILAVVFLKRKKRNLK